MWELKLVQYILYIALGIMAVKLILEFIGEKSNG